MDVLTWLMQNRQVGYEGDKKVTEIEEQEKKKAARKRQKSEQIKKRAVEEMAKQQRQNAATEDSSNKKKAEVEEETPWLQPSSFVPDSNTVLNAQKEVKLRYNLDSVPFYKIPTESKQDKYYPKSWLDNPGRLTYDPQTMKPMWGQTVRDQQERKRLIEDTPENERTQNEFDYYDQLTRQYFNTNNTVEEDNDEITGADVFGTASRLISRNPLGGPLPAAAFADWATGGHLGVANWLDNTMSYFHINKNEAEIGGFQGDIQMNDELRGYIKYIADYQDLTRDLRDARAQLASMDPNNLVGRDYVQQYIRDMESRLPEAERAVDVALSYLNKKQTVHKSTSILSTMLGAMAAGIATPTVTSQENLAARDKMIANSADFRISKDIQNLVDNYKASLLEGDDEKLNQQQKLLRGEMKNILSQLDAEDEKSREGMRMNMRELENWKKWHTPDPEYVAKAQAAARDMSFSDPDTYLFGLPGVLGSSAAFNGLQWANTGLSLLAGTAAQKGGAVGWAASAPLLAGGQLLGLESAHRENAAEVVEHVNETFQNQLTNNGKMEEFMKAANKAAGKELTFEEAMREMALGTFTPSEEIKKLYTNSTFGADNLFMHDMLAVTGENLLDATINFVPFGKFAEASWLRPITRQVGKLKRLSAFKAARPELYAKTVGNGGKFSTGAYDFVTNNFSESWYNFGASINPVVGFATATVGAVTKPFRDPATKYVSRLATEQLSKKFGTVADWAYAAPKKLLDAKVIGRSGKDWLSRVAATSYSESIEEGKQYYHGKEFAAGNYAGESDSVWDLLIGDIEGGSKSALQFAGSFLGMSTDKEWISNMRGGFLAGGGHTAIMSGYADFSGTVKEVQANHLVVNNILSTKLQERADIMKGIQYAKRASFGDRRAMMMAFDNVKELQEQITARGKETGNAEMQGIAPELIEEQRELYKRIFNIANDNDVKASARIRGIKPGSDRYATYVSLINFAHQEADKATEGMMQKIADIRKVINQELWGVDNINNISDDEILDIANKTGLQYKRSKSIALTNEAIAENKKNRRQAILNRSALVDYIAHLDALLSYRDQLELKDNKTEADKRKLRSINRQIESLRNSVRDQEEVVDKDGNVSIKYHDNDLSSINGAAELQQQVYDIDLHEIIRDQYRDAINFIIDFDHANGMLYNLSGMRADGVARVADSQIQDIIDKIGQQTSDQYKTTADLTDNKDITITEDGMRHGELDPKAAKKADQIIDRYLKSVKDDEQFNQEIQDDFQRALDELYSEAGSEIVEPEETPAESPETAPATSTSAAPQPAPKPKQAPPSAQQKATPEPLPVEMTVENQEDFGDLADYVDAFNLHSIPSDIAEDVSDTLKQDITQLVKDFNKWLTDVQKAKKDGLSRKRKQELIEEYNDLIDRVSIANEKLDSEQALIVSKRNDPANRIAPAITEEDIVEAIISPMEKWINDLRATAEYNLNKMQEFLQNINANQNITQQGIAAIKQVISNLDGIFNLVEQLGLDIVTAGNAAWYIAAKQKILGAINAIDALLPEPIIPRPTIPTEYIPDASSWTLYSRTRYSAEGTKWKAEKSGILESVAVDDESIKLKDVIGDPTFTEDAEFEIILKGNNQPFVRITYKGHTFTDVFIQSAGGQNYEKIGKPFWNAMKVMFNSKRSDQKLVPVFVYRSPGKEIRRDEKGNLLEPKLLTQVGLINDENMYELEFSANQNTFGITEKHLNADNVAVTTVYTPSESGKGHAAKYEYSNSSHDDNPGAGLPIFLYDRKFSERGNRRTDVPINLLLTKITEGDARLIVEILQGAHCADKNAYGAGILGQQYVQDDGKGNLIEYGITNGEVLRLLIKFGAFPHEMRHLHIEFKPEDNRFIKLVGLMDGEDNRGFDPNKPETIPSREYNIHDEAGIQKFMLDVVGKVNRRFDQGVASSRVGEKYDDKSHFYKLNQKRQSSPVLQKMLENGGQIQFGNSSIVFDKQDFENAKDPNTRGVSGVVWYARHGFLKTRFNGFDNTILVFDENAGLKLVDADNNTVSSANVAERIRTENEKLQEDSKQVDETPVIDTTPLVEEEEPRRGPINRTRYIEADDEEFRKEEKEMIKAEDRVNMSEARQHLLDILGNEYYLFQTLHDDTTESQMNQLFKNGPQALGTCSNALIQLSKYARRGTEYHEAFHFIVEYLFNDKDRMKLYEAYAKAKHIKLRDADGKIIIKNAKLVTEGLADEYMMYNMDRPTIKLGFNKNIFKALVAWAKFFNRIGSARLLLTYYRANSGKYKNIKPSKSNQERAAAVLKSYGDKAFFFTVGQRKFSQILNNRHYRALCDTMKYILIQSQDNIDVAGRNIAELKLQDADTIREYKLFKKYSAIEPALTEMLDNWDVVSKDIKSLIAQIASPNKSAHDNEDNVNDAQGDEESIMNAGIGEHTRNSNEFSQFSRATDMVKFFFATIPNVVFRYNEKGEQVKQMIPNGAGLPSFVKADVMYNTVLNQVYNCRSLSELMGRLESLGKENAQFDIISKRFADLKKNADEGNVRDATLLTQLCVNLHASKGEYITVKAHRDKNGNFDIFLQPSDGSVGPGNIRRQWSRQFAGGVSAYITQNAEGTYVMKGGFKPTVFKILAQYMLDLQRAVSDVGIQAIGDRTKKQFTVPVLVDNKIQERVLDVTKSEDLQLAKSKLISVLNKLGITFTVDMLNYMLNTKYGSSDYQALNKLFTDNSQTSIQAFALFIQGFNVDGKLNVQKGADGWTINSRPINQVFNRAGFVGMLSDWAYNYKKSTDQLSILANKENRQYLISENNYLTDTIDDMNASISGDNQKIEDLKSFIYNWYEDPSQGQCCSIILRNYSSNAAQKLNFVTDNGFRTDTKGDIGEDYAEITQAQDEVSKMEMLLQGKIVFPTMSDKKTWGYVDGIHLPGLDFTKNATKLLSEQINTVTINPNGSYIFGQNDEVLEQLRQYAILEYQAVIQTLKDIKGYTDPITGIRTAPLQDTQKIDNYHKATVKVKGKTYKIIQGARFSTLYAIYDNKGKKISLNRVCDSNGNFVSEEDNIAVAMERFFGVPSENDGMFWIYDDEGNYVEVDIQRLHSIQKSILRRSLQMQLRKQMQKAEKLGLIQRISVKGPYIYQFKNKLLSKSKIDAVKKAILDTSLTDEQKESFAIAILLNDVSCKSIMSLQEVERIFSGHPAFYKWKYNSKGELSDRSTDQHKRFGGLVSTGQNNAFVFKGLPTKYTVAEINDVEVESEHMDDIRRLMYENELRSTYLRKLLNDAGIGMEQSNSQRAKDLAKKADESTLEEIENNIDPLTLSVVKRKATQKINSFRKSAEERLDGINVADGATYITDEMCENLLKQVGSYSPEISHAFKILRGETAAGKKYTTKDIREMAAAYELITTTVIGTQKYTAYGFRKQNGVLVPYYNKTALFPMFKSLCTGKTADLLDKMKKQGVDMVMLKSAVKVGSQGSQDIDWDNFDSFTFNKYEQEYRYLRKQFNTDPKEKELMAMGTQMTKIILSSIIPGRDYVVTNPDGSKTLVDAKALRDSIMQSINDMSDIGYEELRERLFKDGRLDVVEFSKFLTEELSNRGASREMLDAVSVVDANTPGLDPVRAEMLRQSGKKELKVPLAAMSGMNWIQSIINSKVNKSVIDINTPGAAFIQRSIFGMEGPTMMSDENLPPSIYDGRKLAFRNENGSMDCVLSIDFFKHIIPEGLSFEKARQWLIDNKIISGRLKDGTWSDADASIVGYRIPTQAQSSIHALRVVDVIEAVNDTIVLPTEFTKITGADFDIDKLFLSTFFYKRDGEGNVSKVFEPGSKEAVANNLISMQIALLKDSKSIDNPETRAMHSGDGPVDGDTKLLTDIVEDLRGDHVEELDPYDTYSLWRNTSVRNQFITGKFGIGPFALNNNNHILTMLYGVSFAAKKDSILTILGKNSLHDSEDMYGESIMSWLSGLINAHVDIAKDPYIPELNVNSYTYNLVNLMIRTGFGKKTFHFMTQPIMRELAEVVNNAASAYGSDANKSKYRRQKDAEEKFILDYGNEYLDTDCSDVESLKDAIKAHFEKKGTRYDYLYKSIFDPKSDVLRVIAKSGEDIYSNEEYKIETQYGTIMLNMQDIQLLVYLAKSDFDPYSQGVSNLVKYCKIDTKKQGKTIAEQRDFMRGYKKLFNDSRSKMHRLFDGESLARLQHMSYVDVKTINATKLFSDIISDQLLDATDSFDQQVSFIVSMLNIDEEDVTKTISDKVSNSLLVSLRSDYFNQYASLFGINIRDLVSGDNTIYDKLNNLKNQILSDPKYAYLRGVDGSIGNYLLDVLTSGYMHEQSEVEDETNGLVNKPSSDTYPKAKFISTMSFMDDDSIDQDEMMLSWEELLEDSDHPELQQFARELIVYSFITTGGNGGSNNIFKYIPTSWIINPEDRGFTNSYAYYMAQILENYRYNRMPMDNRIDDIILNNWTDYQFIPSVDISKFDKFYTGNPSIDINEYGQPVPPQVDVPLVIRCDGSVSTGRFIKINRNHDPQSQRSVAIYKLVRVGYKKVDDKYTASYVYVLVEPKGQNFYNTNKIYEYGRSDSQQEEQSVFLDPLIYEKTKDGKKQLTAFGNLAVGLGADINNIEDILDKFITFVQSKQDKQAAIAILTDYNTPKQIVDTIVENTINKEFQREIEDGMFDIDMAEEWSKKEGWSVDYFRTKVLPRIEEAWQTEFEVIDDQSTPTDKTATMNYRYGPYKREDVKSESTIEAIKAGERTATTRYVSDGKIEFWKNLKVGDIVEFHDDDGNTVKVKITKEATNLFDQLYDNTGNLPFDGSTKSRTFAMLSPEDNDKLQKATVVWAHPGIGKTYLHKQGRKDIIDFDSEYKSRLNKSFGLPENASAKQLRLAVTQDREQEYHDLVMDLFEEAVKDAKESGRKLLVSDMMLLREREDDIDVFINMSDTKFIDRSRMRGDDNESDMMNWKNNINRTIQKIKDQSKIINTDAFLEQILPEQGVQQQVPASYEGMITPDANTIFVFGSNPEGRHGAGAAKTAREKFGAIYGQGEGLQGNSYALPTKDLRVRQNRGLRSISPEQITESIKRMYQVAAENPDKQFKVAYTNGLNEATLNWYTGREMIQMFKNAGPIPSNVVFSKNWTDHWNEVQPIQQSAEQTQFSIFDQLRELGEDLMKKCNQ